MRVFGVVGFIALLVLLPGPGIAADGVARLRTYLQELTSLQARFEQQLFDEYGALLETSAGEVSLAKPGLFKWEYQQPYEQAIISNGTTLWIYDADLEQVTVDKITAEDRDSAARLLADDVDIDTEFEISPLAARDDLNPELTWLSLTPKANGEQYRGIEIGLDGEALKVMRIEDNLGQTTQITFLEVTRNAAMARTTFAFEPPQGTDIVYAPRATAED